MIRNVLIVDDDHEMLLAIKEGLDKFSETFSVLMASDGEAAIEMMKRKEISLIVTDLKMPRMDGFTLLAFIMENYPDIPVIIITGYSTPEMEKLAKEGGAIGYISKPFMIDDLAKQILGTIRKESEGGTLHSVSSGVFLQLMEMEQKTCTIRLTDKPSELKGVLFFKEGELFDARVNDLKGEEAALEIFTWDKVNLSIQNVCSLTENKINKELQPLILEAMRIKDEKEEKKAEQEKKPVKKKEEPAVVNEDKPVPLETPAEPEEKQYSIKNKLDTAFGDRSGVEDIYEDSSWDGFLDQLRATGKIFNDGKLKVGYFDKGANTDFIVVPGEKTTIISVNSKCPRDKIMLLLDN